MNKENNKGKSIEESDLDGLNKIIEIECHEEIIEIGIGKKEEHDIASSKQY